MHTKNNFNNLTVALVYDHLTTSFGGAELVLQTLHEVFPEAPIFTSVYELPQNNWAQNLDVRTSFLQNIPLIKKFHQLLAPLHPLAFENHNLQAFDIIISVSNGPAKGVLTLPHQLHLCYLLTPTRYLVEENSNKIAYIKSQPIFSIPGISIIAKPFFKYLKRWDQAAAWRPDVVIAISQLVANRSKAVYNRKVDDVIYPPFKTPSATDNTLPLQDFFLCLTRLTSYKRIDLAIAASLKNNCTLIIAGEGQHKKKLVSLAGDSVYIRSVDQSLDQALIEAKRTTKKIIFVSNCSEEEKATLLFGCKALLMPGEEDFGLVGLEAASAGKPVITYQKSGIAEVLKDKKHSIHLSEQTVEALSSALESFNTNAFSEETLRKATEEYQVEQFKELFHKRIYHFWQQHSTISSVRS